MTTESATPWEGPWAWGGDREPDQPSYRHAIYVPGHGYYGGLPQDIARAIVTAVNLQRGFDGWGYPLAEQDRRGFPYGRAV